MEQAPHPSKPAVLHAAGFDALYGGNFIASLESLAESCAARGREVYFAFPSTAEKRDWCARMMREGRQVRFLPPRATASRIAVALVIERIARSCGAGIIHTHFNYYDLAALAATALLRMRGRRVRAIWHVHSPFVPESKASRAFKNAVKYKCLGHSTYCLAVSEHVAEQWIGAGCSPARVRTILNGIDTEQATRSARSRAEVLEGLGVPPDRLLLLLFGWDPERKGVDLALEAVEALAREGLPVVLGVVGAEKTREFVSGRLGEPAPDWFRFVTPTSTVADLYRASATFLSPSRREGFSYAVIEAMANGLPVVMSDIPGHAHGAPACVTFPSEDAAAFAGAIREALGWSAEERSRRTEAQARFAREKYDVSIWARRVADFYDELR